MTCMMHFPPAMHDVLTQHTSYDCEYFSATTWKTIDGVGLVEMAHLQHPSLSKLQGLNRLPYSFYPHVGAITTMDRMIERAEFLPETNQVQLSWKDNFTDVAFQSATYDYAMIAAPFSKVRSWRFPNTCMCCLTSNHYLSC